MHAETEDTVLRQLTEAFGNRKYFLISAGVTFLLMLAALVTASKHLNNVRNQAVDPRRRVPFRLKQINSQTMADGLLQDLAHFNEVLGPHPKAGDKMSTEEPACRHPDCHWVSLYLNNREHNTVDPCTDLYGHACNHQWRGSGEYPFGPHSFRQLAVGTMVANLHNYFNRTSKQTFQDHLKGRFLHQVSNLYMDCIIEYKGKNEGETLQDALKDFHIHEANHDENLTSLLGSLDRELRVFPFVTVSLAPDTLRVSVTPSTTLLKRYFLSAERPSDEDYTRILAQAMALLKPETDVRKHAQNVHDFERSLQSSIAVLVRAQKQRSTPVLVQNSWDEYHSFWKWDEYFNSLMAERRGFRMSQLLVTPPDLLQRLSTVIGETDTRTLFDYIRLRFVVLVAPFLSEDFRFLLPLGHAYHQAKVPVRSLACLHSIENIYPYAMWFLASTANQMSVEPVTWKEQHKTVHALTAACKKVLRDHIADEDWMMPAELENTLSKINAMGVVTEHDLEQEMPTLIRYYSRLAVPLVSQSPFQAFLTLQQSSSQLYWTSGDENLEVDTRITASSLVPGYEYREANKSVWISPASVALLTAVNVAPIFLMPSVLPYIIMGLTTPVYSAAAMRGYMRHRETNTKLAKTRLCVFEQYYAGMTDLVKQDVALDVARNKFVEFGVLMTLLYDVFQIYKNVTTTMTLGVGAYAEDNSTDTALDRMFLTAWALTQCDETVPAFQERGTTLLPIAREHLAAQSNAREQTMIRFMEVPPRLLVDISAQNFRKFTNIFNCPAGSAMNPVLRCKML
ncbi:uncharacterized protein LOC119402029 [Rhipicephalus sanguineus]|uniref:uncharacterized protein LOC119402029 n=1 Tax=Rhipicephalus sanguineus TaxID=34632 RepID=UPI0018944014|nr:uncharacterized protein LOC119402029 [Rhipicephalus sanguineus]